MMQALRGRAWKFGDEVDTDILAPGKYMKSPLKDLACHCLEAIDPYFAKSVKVNDFVVAGRSFGIGSSREQAAQVLSHLGVAAVIASSFGGIFYRNAFNCGLPAIICASAEHIENGQQLEVNLKNGTIINLSTKNTLNCDPIPSHLLDLINAGGLVCYLEKKLNN